MNVAWRERAALTSQHGRVKSSPEPFVTKRFEWMGWFVTGRRSMCPLRCPDRGFNNGRWRECSRLHDCVAKAVLQAGSINTAQYRLAQSDALISACSSRCCSPAHRDSQKSLTKQCFRGGCTWLLHEQWAETTPPVGVGQTCPASQSVVALARLSNAATCPAFSATAPLLMPSSTLSVVRLSSLLSQLLGSR